MKLSLIVLFIALPLSIFAQSNYHSGYAVKNNGDTLKGYIDYREWERTPKSIQFKVRQTDKNILEFDPQTIKSFEITGMEHYISYSGIISMDQTSFPDLPTGIDTSKMLQNIFLRQITTGKYLKLYYQKDDIKKRFFVSTDGGSPMTELKYYQYYTDEHNVIETTTYRGQLNYYINLYGTSDKNLASYVQHAQFTEADLKKVVDMINGDNGGANNKSKAKNSRFFAGFGVNYTQTLYDVSGYSDGNFEVSRATVSPKLSAGIDLFINPNVQQIILRAEVSVSYVNPRFVLPDGGTYTFNQYTMGITPQILFNIYNKDAFKIYLDGGISFNFSSYSNNKATYASSGYVQQSPYQLESYWASFPLQTGVVIDKRIEIALTYTGAAAYTKYTNFSVANRAISAGFKYLFGR
ncbi:hypothetical protein [Mucilaginibacter sp. BT774]|uniref:hypothetical protein n=1 Tax=Mucilaginibacter sp. BT774 TaxID=3062276 RepID=UPI0026775B64|nr:hypothetical protein [Mucilaginibacter sp. BT774]MDO3627095.1 hypothetical protein [Mucilaginibacter sp. BT774]